MRYNNNNNNNNCIVQVLKIDDNSGDDLHELQLVSVSTKVANLMELPYKSLNSYWILLFFIFFDTLHTYYGYSNQLLLYQWGRKTMLVVSFLQITKKRKKIELLNEKVATTTTPNYYLFCKCIVMILMK